jgi:hypothetical protein
VTDLRGDGADGVSEAPTKHELREHLLSLHGRVRDCRSLARACQSTAVARSLEELADRLEAEAAIIAAKADLADRLEAIPS